MNATTYVAPGLLAMAAAFCLSAGPAGDRAGGVQVVNLGLATGFGTAACDDGFVAFSVSEDGHGTTDLNADGDVVDSVLHLRDVTGAATSNLGFAVSGEPLLHKGYLAFAVNEGAHGATDLNGDGDTTDLVVHVRDLAKGTTTNLGLAQGWSVGMGEGALVFDVDEAAQGATDLNGDGDTTDRVAHVLDLATGVVANTGVAGSLTWPAVLSEGLALLVVQETEQGAADLNGDGDTTDAVLHVVQLPSGAVTNLGLAAWGGVIFPGRIAVSVSEQSQGAVDLNGDADVFDEVLHIHDLATGTANNLGLATWSFSLTRFGTHLAFMVDEFAQGGTDLNGDLDTLDTVLHTHAVQAATTLNLGLASFAPETGFWADGERLAFGVAEVSQGGVDLNGDGDALDNVIHVHDPIRGIVTNLGVPSWNGVLRGKRLTLAVSEFDHGGTDLNLDGDAGDSVLHEYDLVTGVLTNLGLAGSVSWNGESEALVEISEFQQSVDLNGDGDLVDYVVHAHESFAGAPQNLGLASWAWGIDDGLQVMVVLESSQGGTDLNGDGDAVDQVLHTVEVLYPFGLETDADAFSIGAGGTLAFELDAGHAHAGQLHYVLGSLSGATPGFLFGGQLVPLNPDAYFTMTLQQPNQPPFASTLGLLDVMGEAEASLTLPPGSLAALVGLTAHHAYVVIDPLTAQVAFVSNPVPLLLVP